MAYHWGVRCWIGGLAFGTLLGCSDFTNGESGTTGTPETTTGEASEGSSTGTSSTAVDGASGGGSTGDDSASASGDVATTTGPDDPLDDDSTSTGTSGEDESSGGAGFPYAGHYTGTFSANCQLTVQGTLDLTVTPIGSAVGSASAEGQSTPLIGTVSETGVVSIDVTVAGVMCSIDGNLADDASGGSGAFTCPSLSCTGTWSATAG